MAGFIRCPWCDSKEWDLVEKQEDRRTYQCFRCKKKFHVDLEKRQIRKRRRSTKRKGD